MTKPLDMGRGILGARTVPEELEYQAKKFLYVYSLERPGISKADSFRSWADSTSFDEDYEPLLWEIVKDREPPSEQEKQAKEAHMMRLGWARSGRVWKFVGYREPDRS